jgi:Tol biopolymer transport system component
MCYNNATVCLVGIQGVSPRMSHSSFGLRSRLTLFEVALIILAAVLSGCARDVPGNTHLSTPIPFLPGFLKPNPSFKAAGSAAHIAFVTDRDGVADIYVMNIDGTSPHRLTHSEGEDAWPSFSPDGSRIVYQSTLNGRPQIFVMSNDGQHPMNLTASPSSDEFPAWSPDGSRIAFTSDRGGHAGIYIMKSDGSDVIPLTDDPSNNWFPVWAPDGTTIAFISDRDGTNGNIFIMDVAGNHLKQVTTNPKLTAKAAWAPDGQRLAVFTEGGFFSIDRQGNDVKGITTDGEDPAWSPDGKWIAFASRRDTGLLQIYITSPDGSSVKRISNSGGNDWAPAWGP